MTDKVLIPFNDVFFYGLSLRSRETQDVKLDIFANIMMRYLRTLRPVSSRLYRSADGNKYEYNYSFVPSKPLSWRVIKNRRIVEEIEQLSEGKYCLNYYDDQGNDVKRVHFSNQHKWMKTNYYNTIYGDNLICSIVPKELNGQTVLLMYPTGATYPTTLHCCPKASCDEVMKKVLDRTPEPQVSALTNYGVLYFADEETLNIYSQVLSEEESKYADEHKPAVFTTEEDVAGGFCFDADSFDSTKNSGSMFDLSEAMELSDEGFDTPILPTVDIEEEAKPENTAITEIADDTEIPQISVNESENYSLDADLSEAIKIISAATDIHIDEDLVFADNTDETSNDIVAAEPEVTEMNTEENQNIVSDEADVAESAGIEQSAQTDGADRVSTDTPEDIGSDEALTSPEITEEIPDEISLEGDDLLSMGDEDIDDYVRSLIDSLLINAKEAASEYTLYSEDGFVTGGIEAAVENNSVVSSAADFISANSPDATIESNGADYFYYGDTDGDGKRSGYGRTLMSDGKTAYDGEYLDDKRHGTGSFYYKNGSLCYWGDWKENLRNGFGVGISSETGLVHIGAWKNNKPTGVGVRFDSEGNFMYVDSACERVNGGIRVTGFTESSVTVEFWDEKSLKTIKKEISIEDLIK